MAETVETIFPASLYARRKENACGIFLDSGVITAKPLNAVMWEWHYKRNYGVMPLETKFTGGEPP